MDLPAPNFSFSIPSIHDGCQLGCRIYLPHQLDNIQTSPMKSIHGAIVAHPYAPLGGCYDDPVVSFIGGELLHAGYIVGTFNFRGAGTSEGRTSWTAKPELGDYASFYGFMMQYLQQIQVATQRCHADPEIAPREDDQRIQLVLGGYSYGSLIASHALTPGVMVDLFRPGISSPNSPAHEIGRVAREIAARSFPVLQATPAGRADEPGPHASISISYLLVSPLLPPVSQALTAFSSLSVSVAGMSAQARPAQPAEQLSTHRTLALYGDQDTFTSARKLQRWSAELMRKPQSRFQSREIEGAGHFWQEVGVEAQARRALQEWLCQT